MFKLFKKFFCKFKGKHRVYSKNYKPGVLTITKCKCGKIIKKEFTNGG